MTASVMAHNLFDNLRSGAGGLDEEAYPGLWWGQGTPVGTLEPWLSAQKGSIYLCVDNADDASPIYIKVDEGGDDNDWVAIPLT